MFAPKELTAAFFVSPQLEASHIRDAARAGVRFIISFRPDNEAPGQPEFGSLASVAQQLGVEMMHIPVGPGLPSMEAVEAFASAVKNMDGPVLGYCKSGGRAAAVWALAAVKQSTPASKVLLYLEVAGISVLAELKALLEKAAAVEPTQLAQGNSAWDRRYAGDAFLFGTEPNAWLKRNVAIGTLREGSRVLCVADGEGRNSVWLASRGLNVDAFDPSGNALAKSELLARERGVDVNRTLADINGFTWPVSLYDAVVAVFVQFAPPSERQILFENMVTSLKPGGLLALIGYTPLQLKFGTGGPSAISQLYTRELLDASFGNLSGLEIAEFEEVIQEGKGHNGRSALIALIGRRVQTVVS